MTDKTDLIREIHEYVTTHGGENTATHLLVQAASAIQTQAAELEAVGAGGVQALSAAPAVPNGDELRRIARSARTSASDDASPTEYVLAGWKAAMLTASTTPPTDQQAEESRVKLLAECRDAFPIPEPGGPLEVQWSAAMARPEEVPEYVRLCVTEMQAAPKAAPVVWLSSKQLRGVTALHGQYLPFRCQPEGRFDTPVYLVEAAPKAAPGELSADSLRHQNKLLAETLGACILASGIVRKDIDGFTGPELLHFGEDLRSMLEAAPQQEPAPLSNDSEDAARYRWLRNKSTVLHGTAWLGSATAYQRDVGFLRRDDALAALDAAIDAALAAQGGKA